MDNNDPNIDGGYAPWSKWSKCSAECGDGVVTRERTCTKPIPKGKGADCSSKGAASESKRKILSRYIVTNLVLKEQLLNPKARYNQA